VPLPRRLVTARGVRLAVTRVLADDGVRERAARLGSWAKEHDGAAVAADVLEAFAAPPTLN
jgi:UDP:flavonoid glycosyltransferase YjiC (YdhE family)